VEPVIELLKIGIHARSGPEQSIEARHIERMPAGHYGDFMGADRTAMATSSRSAERTESYFDGRALGILLRVAG
jgi:hypothetical protein